MPYPIYPPEHWPEISKERAVQWAANAVAFSLAMMTPAFNLGKNPQAQTALLAGALPLSLIGSWAGWVADHRRPFLAMRQQAGIEDYAEQLSSSPVSAAIPPANQMEFFDWSLLNQLPHKWPHLGIVGGTGDGKSTLAQALIRFLRVGGIAVDPHWKPGNYEGLPVIAEGRNYGDYPGQDVGLSNLMQSSDRISYCDAIATLLKEMGRRYQLLREGQENFPALIPILDEFNTFVGINPKASQDVLMLVREARKVNIRLILLLQSDLLKDLGWEGQGAARKNLRWVRLGEFASNHAQSSLKDEELLNWVQAQRHPILVESQPAILPMPKNIDTIRAKLEKSWNVSDSVLKPLDSAIDSVPEIPTSNGFEVDSLSDSATEWVSEAAKDNAPILRLSRLSARETILAMQDAGLSQKVIIESLWKRKEGGYPAWNKAVKEFKEFLQ